MVGRKNEKIGCRIHAINVGNKPRELHSHFETELPNQILQIAEVPRTLSGKVLEVPIKRILMGAAPGDAASIESLANPHSLDYFVELARRCRADVGRS